MTHSKLLSITLILFFFITSCKKEALEKSTTETETLIIGSQSTETPKETANEVAERMRKETIKFLELTGERVKPELLAQNNMNTRASSYNSGSISVGYPSTPYSNYHSLNHGARTGLTQWTTLTIYSSQLSVAQDAYTNNRSGQLLFNLNGVGQAAILNFSINPVTLSATITPSAGYFASLHSRQIPNTSFPMSSFMEVTVHSNTNGWLWIQVKSAGTTVFSSLYRYNYSSHLDSRNGGIIQAAGFGQSLVGPLPPYSPAGINTNYSGYCGWF